MISSSAVVTIVCVLAMTAPWTIWVASLVLAVFIVFLTTFVFVLATFVLVAFAIFAWLIYANDYYKATDTAKKAMLGTATIEVVEKDGNSS